VEIRNQECGAWTASEIREGLIFKFQQEKRHILIFSDKKSDFASDMKVSSMKLRGYPSGQLILTEQFKMCRCPENSLISHFRRTWTNVLSSIYENERKAIIIPIPSECHRPIIRLFPPTWRLSQKLRLPRKKSGQENEYFIPNSDHVNTQVLQKVGFWILGG
jgi:hypothetical protein